MSTDRKGRRIALWILQTVLAALFLFAGGFKLVTPLATLATFSPLSGAFLKFIGACEVLGGLGLVLPGLLRVGASLTSLAATGLVLIMIGATFLTIVTQGVAPALFPFVVGALLSVVAVGRMPRAAHAHSPEIKLA